MSKDKKRVPELRFPEFDGEWETEKLGHVSEIKGRIGYRGYTTDDIVDKGKGAITLSPSNFDSNGKLNFEKCTYISWEKYNESPEIMLEVGQTVLVKTASVGKSAYIDELPEKTTINPQIVVLKPKKIQNRFLGYSIIHQNTQIQIKKSVGIGAIPNLSQESISHFNLITPPDEKRSEQQKIADCLSSLDDLITAHTEKLQLLKDHKKGLMQNLFPQKDEKVPKFRFPEFRNEGDWEEKKIGDIAKVTAGGTPESTNPEYWNGNIPWMNSGELNNKRIYAVSNFITEKGLKESSTKIIPKKCVLIGLAGQGKTRGTAAINYIELCTNQSIGSIHPNTEVFDSEFLYQKIDSMYDKLRYLSAGDGGRGGLNLQIIKEIEILLPKMQEQQKIASTLSALDELITAQNEKIDQLKQHKKGLMQGLFPKIDN